MKAFNIKLSNYHEYIDCVTELNKYGYQAHESIKYDESSRFISVDKNGIFINAFMHNGNVFFYWKEYRSICIQFMKENSPIGIQQKKEKELKRRSAVEFWQKVMSPDTSHLKQLEQRIHELEIKQITDLDDVNKRMRAIDRKLRYRILMLEGDVHPYSSKARERGEAIRNVSSMIKEELQKTKGQDTVATFGRRDESFHETIKSFGIPKIAIRVENEEEFNELMVIMGCRGWKWISGLESTEQPYPGESEEKRKILVSFNHRFTWSYENEYYPIHEIIPFQTLKAILG